MKAPEKIYITNLEENPLEFDRTWYYAKQVGYHSIEYTRTDAFIEKAEKYLQEHLIDYWSQCITDESDFIENFKNYMKGE